MQKNKEEKKEKEYDFIAKKMKPYPKIHDLEEDFPIKSYQKNGGIKYNSLAVKTVVEYILNKKMAGKYFYKDYANYDNPFESDKGFLKFYDEQLGIWVKAENFIKKSMDEFFYEIDTKEILKCCKFTLSKDTRTSDNKILYVSIEHEMSKVLRRQKNHWNSSFSKKYLAIAYKNGTLFLFAETGKIMFLEEKSPDFLAEIYFNINFDITKLGTENRLWKFLEFKINLDTEDKKEYFKALLFDFFFTENESHHITFFIGENGSGKSTFMKHIQGFENLRDCTKTIDIQKMVGEKFTNPLWFQYPYIFTNETKEKYIEDNATFKQMIAKEEVTIEQKGKDPTVAKAYCKIIGVGEQPLRVRMDGGTDERIINHIFSNKKLNFTEEETKEYKKYYEEIGEKDLTIGDELLQYLAYKKYENLTEILIQGLYAFHKGQFGKSRRTFKKRYLELFEEENEMFGRMQTPFLEPFDYFFESSPESFVSGQSFLNVLNLLDISTVTTSRALREKIEMVNKKLDFNIIFFKSDTKDTKIKIDIPQKNEKKDIIDFILPRRKVWLFGLKIRPFKEIRNLIINNKKLLGNQFEKYDSLSECFKTLNCNFLKEIYKDEEIEKKINENAEEFPF